MPMTSGTAIDISNYTGDLDDARLEWLQANADLVVVRLSTEDRRGQRRIAQQQVVALASRGIPWQGYLWCYWADDPYDHWASAKEMLPPDWPAYYGSHIWLDMEDRDEYPRHTLEWVNSYASLLRTDGFRPGVYTGLWWLRQHAAAFDGDRGRYWAQYPLWWASYGVQPDCQPSSIGPWQSVAMHQYQSVDHGPVMGSYDLSLICNVE